MKKNQDMSIIGKSELSLLFQNTCDVIHEAIGKEAFRPNKQMKASIFDSVMVGVARRIESGEIKNLNLLKERYLTLLEDEAYQTSVSAATSDEQVLKKRIELASAAFEDVE